MVEKSRVLELALGGLYLMAGLSKLLPIQSMVDEFDKLSVHFPFGLHPPGWLFLRRLDVAKLNQVANFISISNIPFTRPSVTCQNDSLCIFSVLEWLRQLEATSLSLNVPSLQKALQLCPWWASWSGLSTPFTQLVNHLSCLCPHAFVFWDLLIY